MKPNQTIPLICGCIALIVCIGIVLNWNSVIDAIAVSENMFTLGFAAVGVSALFVALMACVHFFLKGGKNV
jgi:hypothetical protein